MRIISFNFNNGSPFSEILELQAHRLIPHCNLFEGILCSACLKLQQVQSNIRECKELLETLYIQEAHIKSSVNALHDPITRRLPQELVSKIFIECAPYSLEIGPFFDLTSSYSPRYQFPLGSVSKTWRNIVRSTPQLWTTIRIHLQANALPQMELLRLYLKLSGSLPLHIQTRLSSGYTPQERDYSTLGPMLETLNDFSERWKTLDLNIPLKLVSHVKGGPLGTPMLECLRISNRQLEDVVSCHFHISYGPPSPRVVDTHRIAFPSIGINWTNVTEVALSRLKSLECFAFFRHATQLVNFTIEIVAADDPRLLTPCGVLTVPRLASWDVGFFGNPALFLEKLILPALIDLKVKGNQPFDSLEFLFRRSMCPLRSLSLRADFRHVDVIPILQATPLLKNLFFSNANFRGLDEFFEILANTKLLNEVASDSDSMFLPHLATLHFSGLKYKPWNIIPSLFPPDQRPPHAQYRPFRELKISMSDEEYGEEDYLEWDLVRKMMEIRQQGHVLAILNKYADGDLIQDSYDYYLKVAE